MADRETATGDLGLVQAFVNTVDLQDGPEELTDPNTLKGWLVAKGLMGGSQPVGDADLKHAIALREAIRGMIAANSGSPIYPVDIATLNHAAVASGLRMRFGTDGKPRLEPDSSGVVGAMGRLVATLYSAMEDEDWTRLKLCGSQSCRWVFFDLSKNHSSRWCTMASCGNREKARRFRSHSKARQ
ncbi:MAG TPA: CGNR zinc finger domain-containing protein [Candidatus Dormibacteraeota bacterium]|nr:CGNR zinc finger domain-containing protein [Candidatus Dormibacteraeota bacterium]